MAEVGGVGMYQKASVMAMTLLSLISHLFQDPCLCHETKNGGVFHVNTRSSAHP